MTWHDPAVTLRQMRDIAQDLREITAGRTREEYLGSTKMFWALQRGLEMLGEAANRLPERIHRRYSDVAWREMVRMRNRLIHLYDNVDPEAVWNVVQEEVPRLIKRLDRILPDWPLQDY